MGIQKHFFFLKTVFGWKTKLTLDDYLICIQNLKPLFEKGDGCLGHPVLECGLSSI